MLDKSPILLKTTFQVLIQALISQLVVVGKPTYLHHMNNNIKITFFNSSNLSKNTPNVSLLLSLGFEIYVHTKMTLQQQPTEVLYV